MSARKIEGNWYADFHVERRRYRVRSPENSKRGAVAYEAVLRHRLAQGEQIMGTKQNPDTGFEAFADKWLVTYVEPNNKDSEVRTKRSITNQHLKTFFGRMKLAAIKGSAIETYKAQKTDAGLSSKTINNHLAILRRCLRCALEWGELETMPHFRSLRVSPVQIEALTDSECGALLADISNPKAHLMILTALHAGMRLGELCALQWKDVDFSKNQITVARSIVRGVISSPKSNKIRRIPMTATLRAALMESRAATGLVFPRNATGEPLSDMAATVLLRNACKRAGVRRIGWHKLRHTFASQLVSRGVPMRAIQNLLGHSTVVMTERYAHFAPNVLDDAVQVLDRTPVLFQGFWAAGGQEGRSVIRANSVVE